MFFQDDNRDNRDNRDNGLRIENRSLKLSLLSLLSLKIMSKRLNT